MNVIFLDEYHVPEIEYCDIVWECKDRTLSVVLNIYIEEETVVAES